MSDREREAILKVLKKAPPEMMRGIIIGIMAASSEKEAMEDTRTA